MRNDVSDFNDLVCECVNSLNGLDSIVTNIGDSVSKAIAPAIESLHSIEDSIYEISEGLRTAIGLINAIQSSEGNNEAQSKWYESLYLSVDEILAIISTATKVKELISSIVAWVGEYVAAVKLFAPEVGLLIAMFPRLSGMIATASTWITDTFIPAISGAMKSVAAFSGAGWVLAIIGALLAIIKVFSENSDYVQGRLTSLWEDIIKPIGDRVWESIQSISENLSILWNDVLVPLGEWLLGTFEPIGYAIMDAFLDAFDIIGKDVGSVVEGIFSILAGLVESITALFTFDEEKSQIGMAKIFDGASKLLDGIISFFVDLYEWFHTMCRRVDSAFSEGIWGTILDGVSWVGSLFGQDWSFGNSTGSFSIPFLAHGAVLPANKPFLAVVGDQKHGTNVEAPLATIQQALANVLAESGQEVKVNITFAGELAQLARVLKPAIDQETVRKGRSLAKVVAM